MSRHGHPVTGIIAFVIPVINVACCGASYALTYVLLIFNTGSMAFVSPRNPLASLPPIGYGMIGSLLAFTLCTVAAPMLSLIGLALAVTAYRRKDKERTFPTLGIIANGTLFVYACLIVGLLGIGVLTAFLSAQR